MSVQYLQNKVSGAIWPWQETGTEMQTTGPSLAFSLGTLLIGCTVGLFLFFYGHSIMAFCVFCISSLVFLSSRFFPVVYVVIEQIFQKFSHFAGTSLTWIFLLPFFYICFSSGRILQKIKGKDPMQRYLDFEAVSYWQTCKEASSVDDYKRQF